MKDHPREIRAALTDVRALVTSLKLQEGARVRGNTVMVRCPAHGDSTPSCSIRIGGDRTIAVNCFGCDLRGDALRLIATVHKLNEKNGADFKEILLIACDIAGLSEAADEIRGNEPRKDRPIPQPPQFIPDRVYPPASELGRFWSECGSVQNEDAVKRILEQRGLEPREVDNYELAKAITSKQWLPQWATYQGNTWRFSGHRLVVPVYDHDGIMRSVRAWDVEGKAEAKRLPPAGHKATGLAMGNSRAVSLLSKKQGPCRIIVTEGEPDFLSASSKWFYIPVMGLISGTWSADFAAKIPLGSEVVVMTHHDKAGDKYAEIVKSTVKNRAVVLRSAI